MNEELSPCCDVKMKHLHNEAHGISGTHMANSERYECSKCNKSYYKEEGEKIGLKFFLD